MGFLTSGLLVDFSQENSLEYWPFILFDGYINIMQLSMTHMNGSFGAFSFWQLFVIYL